jgi:hypothetical protein
MYSVATSHLSLATQFPLLDHMGRDFMWLAVFAWALTLIAMIVSNLRGSGKVGPYQDISEQAS